jgi:tetratricopeptide (TPR) repeat protein
MKTTFSILTLSLILTSCDFRPKSTDQIIKEIREDFAKEAEISNAKTLAWENLVDSLYRMADINQTATLRTIDNLISSDTSLDRHKISELHFIKGDIYYRVDSLQKSLIEFTIAAQAYNMRTPKDLAARAGVYVKLKQYDNAFADLKKAAELNYDYFWNLGNYYEVIGNKDSATSFYNRLYNHDTTIYKFCLDRTSELKNPNTKLLTELVYRDRKRMVILMKGVE